MNPQELADRAMGITTLTLDVRTKYPHLLKPGTQLWTKEGATIGAVTDSVVQ